jgi:hypothetical protein
MLVPGTTIRAMPGDLEPLPARDSEAASGAGPAAMVAELLGRVRAELSVVGELGELSDRRCDAVAYCGWRTGEGV